MRSGGKKEGEEVRRFKGPNCPLHCRSDISKWTVKKKTRDYIHYKISIFFFLSVCLQNLNVHQSIGSIHPVFILIQQVQNANFWR